MKKELRFQSQAALDGSYVTLSKSLHLSKVLVFHLENGDGSLPTLMVRTE